MEPQQAHGPSPLAAQDGLEDRRFQQREPRQFVRRSFHPPQFADVAPVDSVGVVVEAIVGKLLQPGQLGVASVVRAA